VGSVEEGGTDLARQRIRTFGDPVLRTKALEVVDFDRELRKLVRDLGDTMLDAGGVGLAANQIGVLLRVFTYLPVGEDDERPRHLVNPELVTEDSEQVEDEEGCLSIPGIYCKLSRSRRVVARGFDVHGEPLVVEGTERLARCFLHEVDHLNGVLFIDRLEPDERRRVLAQIAELKADDPTLLVKESPHAPLA
jgi:peptide deformylase